MPKSAFWIDSFSKFIYVCILILSWFQALYLIYPRFDISVLPDTAIFWLLIVIWPYTLLISYVSKRFQSLLFILFALIGILSGYWLFHDLITSIILMLSLIPLSYRAVLKGIGRKEIISIWMTSIIFFGFMSLLVFFMRLTEVEVTRLIYFFSITLVLAIIGASVAHLNHRDQHMSMKELIKQWKIHNRWMWASIAIVIGASIVLLLIGYVIYTIFRWLTLFALKPIAEWVFTDVINWLRLKMAQIEREMMGVEIPPSTEEPPDPSEFLEAAEVSPFWDTFWNIFITVGFIALIIAVMYLIVRFIKKNILQKQKENTSGKQQQVRVEQIQQEIHNHHNPIKQFFANLFYKNDVDSLHIIRKDFRELLKLLREKGYYENDAMTVQQINQQLQDMQIPSYLYERLRYGDQELTDEEIKRFKVEIQRIKKQLSES